MCYLKESVSCIRYTVPSDNYGTANRSFATQIANIVLYNTKILMSIQYEQL